jgi:leucyl aminopeptidase (aminopeptidase T)
LPLATLKEAARVALEEILGLRPGEEVLIVTDFGEDAYRMARLLFERATDMGGKASIFVQAMKTTFDDADRLVLEAIRACPDITITMCSTLSGNDPYGYHTGYVARDGDKYDHAMFSLIDGDKRMRGLICEGATDDILARCVAIDYGPVADNAASILKALDNASEIQMTTPAGTDVTLSVRDREAYAEDGNNRLPGEWSDLPAGEIRISPVVGSVNGTIAFDGTMDLVAAAIIPERPVALTIADGFVTRVEGGKEAAMLQDVIRQGEELARKKDLPVYERNARLIGELGLGTNPAARITGNLIEDEKVCGTAHFAVGYNYDNDGEAFIHQDCLVLRPSI